jgi:hypothetical protein
LRSATFQRQDSVCGVEAVVDRKFTVHEGGGRGPPGRHSEMARQYLQQAIIEILRTLVRGYDGRGSIAHYLSEFTRWLNQCDDPLWKVINDAMAELHKELDHGAQANVYEQEHEDIVLAALQVAAETLAFDDGAKGRLSIRQRKLEQAIESRDRAREEQRRERLAQRPRTPEESKAAIEQAMAAAERLRRSARKPKKPPE